MPSASTSCRWVPWAIAGALAIVAVANGTLAYFAQVSSTGLVTEHSFDKGNDYNRVLAAAAAQDALGWQGRIGFAGSADSPSALDVFLTDRAGRPLADLAVSVRVARPIDPMPALDLQLRAEGEGRYGAALQLPRQGQWEVHVAASRGAERYEFTDRILVK